MDNLSQRMLGKYRIIEELGTGGFAVVYHAVDTALEHEVALKILKPELARGPDVLQRFQQEARVTARLFHPNIVSCFETGELDGRQFIALRYIHGRSLRAIVDSGEQLPLARVVAIAEQIGAALDYAHAQGIIHRDVKPSNIIVDESGHATLMDFGIVKSTIQSSIQTTTNTVVGTPHYLAPEQAESRPVDGRADVYALGALVYHLLTGQPPFTADSTPSLLYKIVHETPAPPPDAGPRIAGEIGEVVFKAMAKTPEARYQTCAEFAAALGRAVDNLMATSLDALRKQAAAALEAEDFAAAETALQQALAIQPDDQEAHRMMDVLRQRQAAAARYAQLAEKMAQLRAEAAELQAQLPSMSDPQGVLRSLQMSIASVNNTQDQTSFLPYFSYCELSLSSNKFSVLHWLSGWTVFLSLLYLPLGAANLWFSSEWWSLPLGPIDLPLTALNFPLGVLCLLGITSGIVMSRKKALGRTLALIFMLFSMAWMLIHLVVFLGISYSDYQVANNAVALVQVIFVFCGLFAFRLNFLDIKQELGIVYRSPAALWPIAFPLLFTGIGTIPAIGLLSRKNWGRAVTQWVLVLFCLAGMVTAPTITIGSAWAILQLRSPEFRAWVRGEIGDEFPSD